jgi:nucleoid-associated protein YgaU
MNKETKIGLAVLGVLLAVFSGLLVRRYLPAVANSDTAADSAAADSRAGAERPMVVAVETSRGVATESASHARGLDTEPDRAVSPDEPPAELPRRGYMPQQVGSTGARDRYGRELPASSDDIPPATADPFQTGSAESAATPPDEVARAPRRLRIGNEPEAATDGDHAARRAKNPLRRLSAEMPIEESDVEPLSTAAAEPKWTEPDLEPLADPQGPAAAPAEVEESPQAAALVDREAAAETALQATERRREQPAIATPSSERAAPVDPAPHGKYTVQPNDNLWSISEKVYGTGRYFKAIGEHNRAKLPRAERLQVGNVIDVPPAPELEDRYPELCPKQSKSVVVQPRAVRASAQQPLASDGSSYVVEEGDTLFDIARYELGKASRWAEIYELNRDKLGGDVDYLQPGTELAMPPRSEVTTRGSSSRYQR